MTTGKWPKKSIRKHPDRCPPFSPVFAYFRPFLHLLRWSSHFLGCLFLTLVGRPFSHFFVSLASPNQSENSMFLKPRKDRDRDPNKALRLTGAHERTPWHDTNIYIICQDFFLYSRGCEYKRGMHLHRDEFEFLQEHGKSVEHASYSRQCEYRPRMCSRKHYFSKYSSFMYSFCALAVPHYRLIQLDGLQSCF